MIEEVRLVRAVVYHEGRILLMQDGSSPAYYLPGGQVSAGEPAQSALVREFKEKLGWSIHVGAFVGCIEHKWNLKGTDGAAQAIVEMNYLFRVGTSPANLMGDPVSKVSGLKYSWIGKNKLSSIQTAPASLKNLVPGIIDSKPVGLWASS